MQNYSKRFFSIREKKALQSAKEIVPIVMEYIKPTSVIDIGCGNGTWLSVFAEYGICDLLGVDGGVVDESNLLVSMKQFQNFDLSKEKFRVERKYDLVVSLEVAEHIPNEKSYDFVKMLTDLGDIVMFSAAVPGQGGVDHINEKWQSYWAEIFQKFDYEPRDFIRSMVWDNPYVRYWYKQNIMIYCKNDKLNYLPKSIVSTPVNLVHPEMYSLLANTIPVQLIMKVYFFFKKVYLRLPF